MVDRARRLLARIWNRHNNNKHNMNTAEQVTDKHRSMVFKLAKDPQAILASLHPQATNLLHACVGIMDEHFELNIAKSNLDKVNQLEELGDMLFYTELLTEGFGDQFNEFKYTPLSRDETFQLLARTVKRHVFYEQELNLKDLSNVYKNLKSWIEFDAKHIAVTLTDVANHNMDKLGKRYPNFDYSDARAKERADKEGDDDTNQLTGKPYIDDAVDFQGAKLEAMGE